MPTYEYECSKGHRTEVFYKTFTEAKEYEDRVKCDDCWINDHSYRFAPRIMSIPLAPHLYGDPVGYHKPSPTKRFTYKTVSQREGNASSVG